MNGKSLSRMLAAGFLLLAAIPALGTATAARADTGGGTVYLALGDSLAVGEGATDHDRLGYVPHLYEFFHGESHGAVTTLKNLSVGGATSGSFIAERQLDDAVAAIADPATTVSVVTLDIGGNDLLDLLKGGPCVEDPAGGECTTLATQAIGQFAVNYYAILSKLQPVLQAEPGQPDLYVMTYYNPWSGTGGTMEAVGNALLPVLNSYIAGMGQAFGATVVDVYPKFVGKGATLTHILEDPPDIHPNNAGYAQIATVFEAAYLGR